MNLKIEKLYNQKSTNNSTTNFKKESCFLRIMIKEKSLKFIQKVLWNYNKWTLTSLLQKPNFAKIYEEIALKERVTTLNVNDLHNVYTITLATKKIRGDIAEVGVYRGSSAKVICKVKENRILHLFDTFEGLPETDSIDFKYDGVHKFKKGDFSASFNEVKKYLKKYKNVYFYKGIFPETSKPINNKKFSFVHFDVDIYRSAKDCLEFFYPRMSKGGVILSHDFPVGKGVVKAFEEFFKDKPETFIPLLDKHVMVVKL